MRAHVFVSGRVQGVFFRQETYRRASRAKLGGWVRNLADGRVEAVLEGPPFVVEPLVSWMRSGPRGALVNQVDVTWGKPAGEPPFRIR